MRKSFWILILCLLGAQNIIAKRINPTYELNGNWQIKTLLVNNKPKKITQKVNNVNINANENFIGFTLGCNSINAKIYFFNQNKINIKEAISTKMACLNNIAALENAINAQLQDINGYTLKNNELTFLKDKNKIMVLTRKIKQTEKTSKNTKGNDEAIPPVAISTMNFEMPLQGKWRVIQQVERGGELKERNLQATRIVFENLESRLVKIEAGCTDGILFGYNYKDDGSITFEAQSFDINICNEDLELLEKGIVENLTKTRYYRNGGNTLMLYNKEGGNLLMMLERVNAEEDIKIEEPAREKPRR
jgi:heat shock protein HslJ